MPVFKRNNSIPASTQPRSFGDDSIINFLNPSESQYISATDALKNSDIFSIVSQLSSDLAIVKYAADSARTQSLINSPSSTTNGHAFWQSMFAQLLLGGEAFAYRWRNSNGVDMRWEYLRPSQVSTFLLDDGRGLVYNATFDEPTIGVVENIPQNDMLHMRLLSTNGGMTGISPLSALGSELKIKESSNRLTISALLKSIINPGVLSIKKGGLLGGEEKASRSRAFLKQMNDANSGPIVLDDLEEYTPLEIRSNVSQLLGQTDWTGRQIAKVFGVPDSYLNGQGDQQSNIDQIKGMYANALNRYASSAVEELNYKLSANVTADLQPALDPLGVQYASQLRQLTSSGGLSANQTNYLLKQVGFIPADTPDAQSDPLKGGVISEDN